VSDGASRRRVLENVTRDAHLRLSCWWRSYHGRLYVMLGRLYVILTERGDGEGSLPRYGAPF